MSAIASTNSANSSGLTSEGGVRYTLPIAQNTTVENLQTQTNPSLAVAPVATPAAGTVAGTTSTTNGTSTGQGTGLLSFTEAQLTSAINTTINEAGAKTTYGAVDTDLENALEGLGLTPGQAQTAYNAVLATQNGGAGATYENAGGGNTQAILASYSGNIAGALSAYDAEQNALYEQANPPTVATSDPATATSVVPTPPTATPSSTTTTTAPATTTTTPATSTTSANASLTPVLASLLSGILSGDGAATTAADTGSGSSGAAAPIIIPSSGTTTTTSSGSSDTLLLVVIGIAAIGGGAYFLFFRKKKKPEGEK